MRAPALRLAVPHSGSNYLRSSVPLVSSRTTYTLSVRVWNIEFKGSSSAKVPINLSSFTAGNIFSNVTCQRRAKNGIQAGKFDFKIAVSRHISNNTWHGAAISRFISFVPGGWWLDGTFICRCKSRKCVARRRVWDASRDDTRNRAHERCIADFTSMHARQFPFFMFPLCFLLFFPIIIIFFLLKDRSYLSLVRWSILFVLSRIFNVRDVDDSRWTELFSVRSRLQSRWFDVPVRPIKMHRLPSSRALLVLYVFAIEQHRSWNWRRPRNYDFQLNVEVFHVLRFLRGHFANVH